MFGTNAHNFKTVTAVCRNT